jgi:hypothetical protein
MLPLNSEPSPRKVMMVPSRYIFRSRPLGRLPLLLRVALLSPLVPPKKNLPKPYWTCDQVVTSFTRRLHVGRGTSRTSRVHFLWAPRNIEHAWAAVKTSTKVINTYQPAGKIEGFFQVLARFKGLLTREQAMERSYTTEQVNGLKRVVEAHGMNVTGPPLDVHSNEKWEKRA